MSRLSNDEYFLEIANTVSQRGTCARRKVGCVLVDSANHIVATGYNGVPSGFIHCLDQPQRRLSHDVYDNYSLRCVRQSNLQFKRKEGSFDFSVLPKYFIDVRTRKNQNKCQH